MIHIIGLKTGPHQFLHQIGFFIGAFGGSESGQGRRAMFCLDSAESGRGHIQRFFPCRFPEMGVGVGRVKLPAS